MISMTQSPYSSAILSIEDEAELVCRVKAGDQAACARLVKLFGPQMMIVARRFMQCDDDCNDAIQDAFISAFNALARFEGNSRLSTWLHRITVNSCLTKLRFNSSRKETSIDELLPTFDEFHAHGPAAVNDPSKDIEIDETRTLILAAINKLAKADREVLLLRDIEEMDTAATAVRLETSEHNVKRRLRRARLALCVRLEPIMGPKRSLNRGSSRVRQNNTIVQYLA